MEILFLAAILLLIGPAIAVLALHKVGELNTTLKIQKDSFRRLQERVHELENRLAAPVESPPRKPPIEAETPEVIRAQEPVKTAVVACSETIPEPTPHEPTPSKPKVDWRGWLRKLHLCPPEHSQVGGEIGLAGWWTTRIGILLGIIAVVFLGLYVNRMTSPWVRFVELLGISGGVFGLGTWLAKRFGRFGDIVSSGGLAMFYFTTYAAHGMPAVQITSQPWVGVLLQVASLGTLIAWSLRKNDANLASFALGLGYVSCAFSAFHSLPLITLWGIVLLSLVGGSLHVRHEWRLPLLVSTLVSYGGLLFLSWGALISPAHLLATAVALLAIYSLAISYRKSDEPWSHRFALGQGSGAAIATVFGMALIDPTKMSLAYLTLALSYGVHAGLSWRGPLTPKLFPGWFLKAATFLALYVASEFDGPTRWLALMAQSFSVLWTMRERAEHRRWLEVAFVTLWAIAYAFFLRDASRWVTETGALITPQRIVAWAYLSVALVVATLYEQAWFRPQGTVEERGLPHRTLAKIMGLLVGVGMTWSLMRPTLDLSVFLVGTALTVGSLLLERRLTSFVPLIAGILLSLFLHIQLWTWDLSASSWYPAGIVALLSGTSAFWLARRACHYGEAPKLIHSAIATWIWSAMSVLTVVLLAWSSRALIDNTGLVGMAMTGIMGAVIVLCTRSFGETFPFVRPVTGAAVGVVIAVLATFMLSDVMLPWTLLGFIALFLIVSHGLREESLSFAVVAPALLVTANYLTRSFSSGWTPLEDLGLGLTLVIGITLGAWAFFRESKAANQRLDALMHAASMLVITLGVGRHLEAPYHWLAMCGVTLGTIMLSAKLPFPTLSRCGWIPALLVLGQNYLSYAISETPIHLLSATLIVTAWRFSPDRVLGLIGSMAAVLWVIQVELTGTHRVLALAVLGIAYTLCWRSTREAECAIAGMVAQGLSFLLGLTVLLDPNTSQSTDLICMILTSLALALQGWLLHGLPSTTRVWRDPLRTWAHAAGAILLLQATLVLPRFGLSDVATACWGLASIALFTVGLVAGLRAYRMIGLLGLLSCIGRMFAVDVEDTFFRIIAFAAVAVVLLGVGFLYTRFRGWIEAHDQAV